jgi:transcription initiation factor IIE alpha subunit
MALFEDSADIELTCPRCGHKFPKLLKDLKSGADFKCPADCGLTLQPADFKSKIEEMEKVVADFDEKSRRIFE